MLTGAGLRTAPDFLRRFLRLGVWLLALPATHVALAQVGTVSGGGTADRNAPQQGSIRLASPDSPEAPRAQISRRKADAERTPGAATPAAIVQGEFEQFVQRLAGNAQQVHRLGTEFMAGDLDGNDTSPLVPPDYVVSPGDEVLVTVWGSVDADLRLIVDKVGRISIPRVGPIQVSGLRHSELADTISRRIGQTYKGFQVSVTLGQLRSIRVIVTGFVNSPGAHVVDALTSLSSALVKAGGPSAAGSFRAIELKRLGKTVATFDLYDLLLRGDRGSDPLLQAGDIIHVGAVGPQVGLIGSVNRPGIFELKRGERVSDVLRMAGGLTAVADPGRLTVERMQERNAVRIAQLDLPEAENATLSSGDVLRAFSAVANALPSERQAKRVRVEGEVHRPAEYILPAGSALRDAIKAAGGLTDAAFIFAAEFTRESVRQNQRENYERALRDLETDLARNTSTQRTSTADDAAAVQARSSSAARLMERLRAMQPSGRVVLQLSPDATELPDLALEDGDRIFLPARSTTVGVFGSVFNAASYLFSPGRSLDDYLRLAGGPTKGADDGSIFVVRANGSVISRLQGRKGWFSRDDTMTQATALPGDTIFVPEEMNKVTFVQGAKDWTQILYQFGIGLAGIKSALN